MVNLSSLIKSLYFYFVILIAIVIHYLIFNKPNSIPTENKLNHDVESAIKRAKTEGCKKELKDFAIKAQFEQVTPILRRTCKLDNHTVSLNVKVGCISLDSAENLTKLEEKISDSKTCFSLCFRYGHSHAGHHHPTQSCYCGDISDDNHIPSDCSQKQHKEEQIEWFEVTKGIYKHSKLRFTQPHTTNQSNSNVRIAFLLTLNGYSTLHIMRLLKNIYSEKHVYLLHVDRRNQKLFDDLVELETKYDNVIVTRNRFETIWGAPSLLSTIIDAMDKITSKQNKWHYMINLSESDFPLKPIADLENYLGEHLDTSPIFLKQHNIEGYRFIKKQGLDRLFYQCDQRAWLIGKRELPRGIIYSGGSDWFALPRDFCGYIMDNLRYNDSQNNLVKALVQFYNYTILPVESFFHTLASNSEFCDRIIDNNLRVTNWHRRQGCKCQHKDVVDWCGCSPLVYRYSDWDRLWSTRFRSDLYFSRKFDPTISSSIIGKVESELVKSERRNVAAETQKIDSRFWQNIYGLKKTFLTAKNEQVLQQFGLFCLRHLNQALIASRINPEILVLQTVDLFFDKDRFVGLVFSYCTEEKTCIQFLVERNNIEHPPHTKNNCREVDGNILYAIEVSHGFDSGERMFRNYLPLNQDSNVVVYHEWVSTKTPVPLYSSSNSGKVKFSWSNKKIGFERIQKIDFKNSNKGTRKTFAHRLNLKSIPSGPWNLKVLIDDRECFNYQFVVFSLSSYSESMITQEEFDKFYSISQSCLSSPLEHNSTLDDCNNHTWSLESMLMWRKVNT